MITQNTSLDVNIHNTIEGLITVVISTKDRWSDLEKALLSLKRQSLKHKVIVMDDNSSDGTYSNVRESFPDVTIYTFEESCGYIVRRNQAIELATTPYVLSIDDDCTLESSEIIKDIANFCLEAKCAAIAWPYIDVRISDKVRNLSPPEGLWQAFTFKGCSFIVNRQLFLNLGGFRESFVHQGEEEDFCLRLLNFGYPVLLGRGHAIHHHESPKRSWDRMDFYGSRNIILFTLFNVPLIVLPLQITASALKCFLYGFLIKRPYQKARGVIHGFKDGVRLYEKERCAVTLTSFFKYKKLKKKYRRIS